MISGNGIWVNVDELISLRSFAGQIFKRTDKKSSSPLAGGYVSPFRGRGVDFSEVREYQPGDDIRSMDWRVMARTGTPHTKLYIEERERPVFFVLDFNPAMFFGTRVCFKTVTMSYAAALLAWAAAGHGDRVGALLSRSQQFEILKPKAGVRGVLALVRHLSAFSQEIPNDFEVTNSHLADLILRAKSMVRPGSLIYVLSDFRDVTETLERRMSALARHCDLVAIKIDDRIEQSPPDHGLLPISNGKRRAMIDAGNSASVARLQHDYQQRQEHFLSFCIRHGIHPVQLTNGDELLDNLRNGLASKHGQAVRAVNG